LQALTSLKSKESSIDGAGGYSKSSYNYIGLIPPKDRHNEYPKTSDII